MSDIQKDLVLAHNQFAYVLDETKGNISCNVGPHKMSLSQSDKLVIFNSKTKNFETATRYEDAISLFVSAPEGWYLALKNPVPGDKEHPRSGQSNSIPDNMQVGRKVNIPGPASFALYPGQMAQVIKGHSLRSNQYLVARVYDADSLNSNEAPAKDKEDAATPKYINGQILIIKGTEVSFYVPPTGIEVKAINNDPKNGYVRDAVTLERLEYCILKDEDGNKRYVHGPEVVFPEPTEQFVTSPKGGYIFRAIELSPISGIYVKVIASYVDEKGVSHPVGEELFITGKDTMIYYPRPEHAIISYDSKIMHFAIAIPEGEGRYIMNRLTGEIKTIKGPEMYLPDPRTEVVVKRKLTKRQCELWFPGNFTALEYNTQLTEKSVEKRNRNVDLDAYAAHSASSSFEGTLANLEAKANISRGTSYTKPRTITLDNKFDGVVNIDVWTGYAINVITKGGPRKVICGPQSVMLDYNQTLEDIALSTGRPKTTDRLITTVYLRYLNNKVSDIINVETKDFVAAQVKVSYTINFEESYKDHWFDVDNYVKYACDKERSLIKSMAKKYTIEEFYQKYNELVKEVALDKNDSKESAADTSRQYRGLFFPQNGMVVTDCEVLSIYIEQSVSTIINEHQIDMIKQAISLSDATKRIEIAERLSEAERKEHEVRSAELIHKMELQRMESLRRLQIDSEINRQRDAEKAASAQAEKDLQPILDEVEQAKLDRERRKYEQDIDLTRQKADIKKAEKEAYANTVAKIMSSISEDLVAAMNAKTNADMLTTVAESLSPYAIAGDNESVSDVVNKLLRGTSLENIVDGVSLNIK